MLHNLTSCPGADLAVMVTASSRIGDGCALPDA